MWKAYQTMLPSRIIHHSWPSLSNCPTGQPAKPVKYYQQKTKFLTKRPDVATSVPSGMNTVIEALVYRGIPLDLRYRPEQSLAGLVVTHSTAGVNDLGFNCPVARTYLRFNSRASTLASKQCLAMRCMVATNCDRIMQCNRHLWFDTEAADLGFDNKRTI